MNAGHVCPKIEGMALPGSLRAEWKRCGRVGCRCVQGARHGPYWYRRWREGRHRRKQYVPTRQLDEVRVAMARWRELHPPARSLRDALAALNRLARGLGE